MKDELKKSLTDLIDETLLELEELKKSRYSAAEIEIKGPGEGIDGKPSNGDLHAKKAEDDKDEDEKKKKDEEEAKKAEGKNEEAAKAEGKNEEAAKAEKDDKKDEDKKEPHKDDPEHEKKEKDMAKKLLDMHKSVQESESLMKSFVEERVRPLEDKLSTILNLVNKIADQPVPAKGSSARAVPLMKSAEDGTEPMSKGEVTNKLFELKKSGTKVDSLDIVKAEMGQDLSKIVEKYKIS